MLLGKLGGARFYFRRKTVILAITLKREANELPRDGSKRAVFLVKYTACI